MAKAYSLIQAQTLTGSAPSITFSNIPQNFTDLKIVMSVRSDRTGTGGDGLNIAFNGVSSSYSDKYLRGNGSVAASYSDTLSTIYISRATTAGATANTFSSMEIYIPNYTSSNAKTVSVDGVSENNGTEAYAELVAGLASGVTAAITQITISSSSWNLVSGSTFYLYGIGGTRATGGTITADVNYTYHTFTSSGTFTALEKINNAEVLLVAGGGGGGGGTSAGGSGGDGTGGGGAGGLRSVIGLTLNAGTSYSTIVGSGGTGGAGTTVAPGNNGTAGSDSTFSSIIATGGGYGANYNSNGGNGGSGGGAGAISGKTGGLGNTPSTTPSQGNDGGIGYEGGIYRGGGGGGAVAAGATGQASGNGGIGSSAYTYWGLATGTGQSVSGTYYYAGGGGGGVYGTATPGSGGNGGGGTGGYSSSLTGVAGTANTGGGGGAGGSQGGANYGSAGNGGSGLIIIRYPNI